MEKKTKFVIVAVLVAAALIGAVAAQVSLHQNFPAHTVAGTATIAANCVDLTDESVAETGATGTLVFDCGTAPALSISNGAPITITPTFVLPTGYTGLGIDIAGSLCSAPTSLTTGVSLTPASSQDLIYCASYDVKIGRASCRERV